MGNGRYFLCVTPDGRTSQHLAGDHSSGDVHDRLSRLFFNTFIRRGSTIFVTASGAQFTYGDGPGEPVQAHFLARAAEPSGAFRIPSSRSARPAWTARSSSSAARSRMRSRAEQRGPSLRSRRAPYSLFLDADKQYSCALFEIPRHIARRRPAPPARSPQSRNTRGASGGERNLLPARAAGMSVKVRSCAVRKIPVICELPHRAPVAFALWCCDAHQDQPADVRSEGRPPH
jgi:hypothetical protein